MDDQLYESINWKNGRIDPAPAPPAALEREAHVLHAVQDDEAPVIFVPAFRISVVAISLSKLNQLYPKHSHGHGSALTLS